MRRVSFCRAQCAECAHVFQRPFLGEFAYGEFVRTTESGAAYAVLDAIDHPAWQRVVAIVDGIGEHLTGRVAAVCARVADEVAGERLTVDMVCPACRSRRLATWGGEVRSMAEVPAATFHGFLAAPPARQVQLVRSARFGSGPDR